MSIKCPLCDANHPDVESFEACKRREWNFLVLIIHIQLMGFILAVIGLSLISVLPR